jgi:NAD(P)H dehydrogenase (quinone)
MSRAREARVLVHGVNGVQGGAIARRLHAEGFAVRGTVRDPARATTLHALGIEVVAADLESRLALDYASRGADAVVLTLPLAGSEEPLLRWAGNAALAARDAGVTRLVLNTSTRIPGPPSAVPTFELRRSIEALVQAAGPPSVVLRPAFLLESLLHPTAAAAMARRHVLACPLPAPMRVAWLAADDLGAFVAAALRHPDLAGRTLDVGGPEPLDGPGLTRALSPALGYPLEYLALPPEAVERELGPLLGGAVARGIARTCGLLARQPDTSLFCGADRELVDRLARPRLAVTTWARAQRWPG